MLYEMQFFFVGAPLFSSLLLLIYRLHVMFPPHYCYEELFFYGWVACSHSNEESVDLFFYTFPPPRQVSSIYIFTHKHGQN